MVIVMAENTTLAVPSVPSVSNRNSNIYKVIAGVALTIVLVVVAPVIAARFGYLSPLAEKAVFILLCTAGGLVVKTIVGDMVAGEFLFYKFGYDNCVVAFGALLTALAVQHLSSVDLFPGLQALFPFVLNSDPLVNRSNQLLLMFVATLGAMLLTGRIAAAIKLDKAVRPNFLSFLNSVIGAVFLGAYVLILVAKG